MDEMIDRKRGVVQMLQEALKQSRMDEIKNMLTSKGPTEDSMSSTGVSMNEGGMIRPDMNTDETASGAPNKTGMSVPDEQKAPELNQEGEPATDDEIEHGVGESEDEENEPAIAMLRKKVVGK